MEHPSQSNSNEPSFEDGFVNAQLGLRGPGLNPLVYVTSLRSLRSQLLQLPEEERIKIGYMANGKRDTTREQTEIANPNQYWVELIVIAGVRSTTRKFANVHQLLEFIHRHQKLVTWFEDRKLARHV